MDTYAQFQALGTLLGTGPSTVAIDWAPVPAGEYVIFAGELNLTAGSRVTAGEANTTWTISTTNDGYYKIASGEECLVMRGNTDLTLNSPQKFGEKPSVEACASSGAANNLQKWWVKKIDGGYALINATTQLPLVVDGESVAQQDPNHNDATAFMFVGDGVSTSTTFKGRFVAGASSKVALTVRNLSEQPATDVVVTLVVPKGWLVSPASITVGDLAAQATKDFTFTITPNAGPASQTSVKFVTDYTVDGQQASREVSIPAVFSCTAAVTSPKEVLRVSSEQNDAQEVALATNVLDGNPNTFWHTQWSPSETKHPHQLVVGLAQEAEICAISLTPRQGVNSGAANGQIKDFDLYATSDRTVAQSSNLADWGQPVHSGSLPSGQSVQRRRVVLQGCRSTRPPV